MRHKSVSDTYVTNRVGRPKLLVSSLKMKEHKHLHYFEAVSLVVLSWEKGQGLMAHSRPLKKLRQAVLPGSSLVRRGAMLSRRCFIFGFVLSSSLVRLSAAWWATTVVRRGWSNVGVGIVVPSVIACINPSMIVWAYAWVI